MIYVTQLSQLLQKVVDLLDRSSIKKSFRELLESVLTIPERELIIGRLDNVVAGSCQLIKPSKNNEAQKNSCSLTFFLAMGKRSCSLQS